MRWSLLFLVLPAMPGHDLYLRPSTFTPAPAERIRVEYHNGDAFPQSQTTVVLARLRDAQRRSASGIQPLENVRNEPKMTVADTVAPERGHFYLVSRTAPNFIELKAADFEKYLLHEGLLPVIEFRARQKEGEKPGREIYSKHVKSLLVVGQGDGWFSQPLDMEIEFVPLDDPYATPAPSSVRVQLLFRGKPAAGHEIELQVAASGFTKTISLGHTNAQGMVTVPVSAGGLHKLHAIVMQRRADRREADWESFWATLTFGTR